MKLRPKEINFPRATPQVAAEARTLRSKADACSHEMASLYCWVLVKVQFTENLERKSVRTTREKGPLQSNPVLERGEGR